MLIVGFGKLVRMVLSHKGDEELLIYNRSEDKVKAAQKTDARIQYCSPDRFREIGKVFLAIPPDATFSFLKEYQDRFPENCVFYHTATMLPVQRLQKVAPELRIVPAKFAGHALQAERENSGGVFVIPASYKAEAKELKQWLGTSFQVVHATEESVKKANEMAVEETIKLIVRLTERFNQEGITPFTQEAVLRQIPAGVLHAHFQGEHGHFAKVVLNKLQSSQSTGLDNIES